MTWPEVFPALVVVVGAAASLLGVALALRRLFRPWVAAVADLKANDFPHLEARIEKRLAEAREDRAAMRYGLRRPVGPHGSTHSGGAEGP